MAWQVQVRDPTVATVTNERSGRVSAIAMRTEMCDCQVVGGVDCLELPQRATHACDDRPVDLNRRERDGKRATRKYNLIYALALA